MLTQFFASIYIYVFNYSALYTFVLNNHAKSTQNEMDWLTREDNILNGITNRKMGSLSFVILQNPFLF
jgi:hypothetical protein